MFALQVPATLEKPVQRGDDVVLIGETSDAELALGQKTRARFDDRHAARLECGQILARRRMLVHGLVHRRCDQNRDARGERRVAE